MSIKITTNPNKEYVQQIRNLLDKTNHHCPCVPQYLWNDSNLCPCDNTTHAEESGWCHCKLYKIQIED